MTEEIRVTLLDGGIVVVAAIDDDMSNLFYEEGCMRQENFNGWSKAKHLTEIGIADIPLLRDSIFDKKKQ